MAGTQLDPAVVILPLDLGSTEAPLVAEHRQRVFAGRVRAKLRTTSIMAAGSSSGCGRRHPVLGGISTAAASAAKVRSAALKRSPHRYGRPSAPRATSSNTARTSASDCAAVAGVMSR
jgi:hypothetical protein